MAKRTANIGKCYVVDGRVRHAGFDPLEIGEVMKTRIKHPMRCGRVIETRARSEQRARPGGQRRCHSASEFARQLRDVVERGKSAGNQDFARAQWVEGAIDRCPRDELSCGRQRSW